MVTESQIRRIALALPGAYEQASHEGCPSWRTKPRMFAWIRTNPGALVVWVDSLLVKETMIDCEPDIFFTTPHYDGHAMLLVRMDAIDVRRARALIVESWMLRAPPSLVKTAAARLKRATQIPRKRR